MGTKNVKLADCLLSTFNLVARIGYTLTKVKFKVYNVESRVITQWESAKGKATAKEVVAATGK